MRTKSAAALISAIAIIGGYDVSTVSKAEFDSLVGFEPGMSAVARDLSPYGLTQMERRFADEILAGKIPRLGGKMTIEEIQALYFSIAAKVATATEKDLLSGYDAFDAIRGQRSNPSQ